MKMLFIALSALAMANASAGTATIAHTKAYLTDDIDALVMDSESYFNVTGAEGNLVVYYAATSDSNVEAAAESAPTHVDQTFGNVRVFFASAKVEVLVDGNCDAGFSTSHLLHYSELKITVDDVELPLNTDNPPVDDTHTFPGGTVVLDHAIRDDHSNTITAIDLILDGGEEHTWGYASAALECTVPVELQSFEVD